MTAAVQQTEAVVEALEVPATAAPTSYEEAAKAVWGDDAPVVESAPDAVAAPAPAAPPPPVEDPKPDPQAERVAGRIAAAKRAEMRAAHERAEIKAEKDAIAREKAALEAQAARFRLLEEDPVKAFEELRLDPKTFLEKLAGEHKPEAVVDRKVAALEAEIAALKAETTRERETARQREQRLASESAWSEASREFVAHIETTAEKYPHLVSEYSEGEAVAAAEAALLEIVGYDDKNQPVTRAEAYRLQYGDYPDNDVIAEHLDAKAKARAEARQKSAWRKRGESAPNGSEPISNGDPNPKAPPVTTGQSPRTLTSRTASEKATAPRQMTQEELDAESMRILSNGFR